MSDDDDYYENDAPDDEGEDDANCRMMESGGCEIAGTEWCDWHCPFSDHIGKRKRARRFDVRQGELTLDKKDQP